MAAWIVVPVLLGIAIGYVLFANRRRLISQPTDDGNISRRQDRPDPCRHQRQSCRNRRTRVSNHNQRQSGRSHLEQEDRSQGNSRRDYGRQDDKWRDVQDNSGQDYRPRFQYSTDNSSTASSMSSFYICSDDSQTIPKELDTQL